MKITFAEFEARVKKAKLGLQQCRLCPRNCDIDRVDNQKGFCMASDKLEVAHIGLHHGEEPFISGDKGSGTIFFKNCNLHCQYCQNWQISHPSKGSKYHNQVEEGIYSAKQLGREMIKLQEMGAHNINLVSPTHYVSQIIEALYYAFRDGLSIPIIYNTSGYDSVAYLELLEGIIDIYLPDIKYSEDKKALKYSLVPNYKRYNRLSIKEMYRQVGNLTLGDDDMAVSGIHVRHLVLPNLIAGSKDSLNFLSKISQDISISLMSQYSPCYKAVNDEILNRSITQKEYDQVIDWAEEYDLKNLLGQELNSSSNYNPDFDRETPFI